MLVDAVAHAASTWPDRPAIVAATEWTVTFRDVDRISDELAVGLARRGIGHGDVVALVVSPSPEYLLLYTALAKLGAITSGVNARLAPPERTVLVHEVLQADHAVVTETLAEGMELDLDPVVVTLSADGTDVLTTLRVAGESPPGLPDDPDRVVAIVCTSGSTGRPKGAVFGNRELKAISIADRGNGWGEGGPVCSNTQMAHIGVMGKIPTQWELGTTLHVIEPWRPSTILQKIERYRMPAVGGVAPQLAMLLRQPDFDDYDLSSVELIVVGGGPASPRLIDEAKRRFDADWTQRYALTETGGVGTFTWIDADTDQMLYTVGRPRPGLEISIRDPDNRPLPDGDVGEVCFRSPTVMREYWRNAEASAHALAGGWLHTGDQGTIDDRGLLRLVGRRGEGYSRGGYSVYPREAENVLTWHPKVSQVAIVPRPDEVMGDIGVAFVVAEDPADPPTLEELRTFGADHLAKFKLPEDLVVVGELPMTAMLKVDRRALTDQVAAVATTPSP